MTPFGPYELLALLAKGGIAEVWLARQRGPSGFEKLIVLKRLHERLVRDGEYVDMFLDEARINARLQHTNVLSVYELGEVDGRYFLAMEYVEGLPLGTLAQKAVSRLSDLPISITGALLGQAANGLHYAHEATGPDGAPMHVVHRDLSPLNLLVSWDGVVKIADFGVAKADNRRTRTKSGELKGTPTYMSPEQCSGGLVDRRSDIFGLGILLWELLTGRRLFKRGTVEETYDAIMTGPIPVPSTYRLELPTSLDALAMRALARRPEERFETAALFATALEQALHKEGLRAQATDVRSFLDEHFGLERAEHEALLARVRQGDVEPERPLFKHADHGLDSGEDLIIEVVPPFNDDDTVREADAPRALELLVGEASAPVEMPPRTAGTDEPTEPSTDEAAKDAAVTIPKRPRPRALPTWLIVLAVMAAIVAALAVGLVAGRAEQKRPHALPLEPR